jgi:hypothetical protein
MGRALDPMHRCAATNNRAVGWMGHDFRVKRTSSEPTALTGQRLTDALADLHLPAAHILPHRAHRKPVRLQAVSLQSPTRGKDLSASAVTKGADVSQD